MKAYVKRIDKIVDVVSINFHKKIITFYDRSEIEWFLEGVNLIRDTEVKDKNNRNVFEGDIYRYYYFPDYKDYVVEYGEGSFFLGDKHLIDVNWSEMEHIGNKYEQNFNRN